MHTIVYIAYIYTIILVVTYHYADMLVIIFIAQCSFLAKLIEVNLRVEKLRNIPTVCMCCITMTSFTASWRTIQVSPPSDPSFTKPRHFSGRPCVTGAAA